jgi:hypothetical protein
LLGRLTTTSGILALCDKREHEVSVYDLAVRARLEFEVLDHYRQNEAEFKGKKRKGDIPLPP